MWTVLIMQCLLHCFSRQGSRVLVVLPPYFCIQQELGVDPSCFDEDQDDSDSGNEKDNKERDYVPVTNQAVNDLMEGKDVGDQAAIIASHKKAFMERAFPSGEEKKYLNVKSKSASTPS